MAPIALGKVSSRLELVAGAIRRCNAPLGCGFTRHAMAWSLLLESCDPRRYKSYTFVYMNLVLHMIL